MTTIAWDGKTLAVDTLATREGAVVNLHAIKACERYGTLYAVTGYGALLEPLVQWHINGADSKETPKCGNDGWGLVVILPDGSVLVYSDEAPYAEIHRGAGAWGSGWPFAIAALDAGASAREAVEIAIKRDIQSGGEVKCFTLRDALAEAAE